MNENNSNDDDVGHGDILCVACPRCLSTHHLIRTENPIICVKCENPDCGNSKWLYCQVCQRSLLNRKTKSTHKNTKEHLKNCSNLGCGEGSETEKLLHHVFPNAEGTMPASIPPIENHETRPSKKLKMSASDDEVLDVSVATFQIASPVDNAADIQDANMGFDSMLESSSDNNCQSDAIERQIGSAAVTKSFLYLLCSSQFSSSLKSTYRFFVQEHEKSLLGIKKLVVRADYGRESNADIRATFVAPFIRDVDAILVFRMAAFSRNLSPVQCTHFCKIIENVMDVSSSPIDATINHPIRIPSTVRAVRRSLVTGVYSVSEMMPLPPIISIPNHSVILPSRWLEFIINSGIDVFSNSFNALLHKKFNLDTVFATNVIGTSLFSSFLAESNFSSDAVFLPIAIIIWSDDFDPNNTVQNWVSVWTLSITFVFPACDGDSDEHTFIVGLGEKGDNHEEAKQLIMDDIFSLNQEVKYFFNPSVSKTIPTMSYLHTSLGDTPERRAFINYSASSGLFACWFGVSAVLNKLFTLPSCNACYERRYKNFGLELCDTCHQCSDWELNADDDGLLFEAPDGYPSVESDAIVNDGKLFLKPKVINFDVMKAALQHGFDMYARSKWNKANLQVYLSRNCFCGDLKDLICCNAVRKRRINRLKDRNGRNQKVELQKLLELEKVSQFTIRYVSP